MFHIDKDIHQSQKWNSNFLAVFDTMQRKAHFNGMRFQGVS